MWNQLQANMFIFWIRGITFHSLLFTHWNSLVAHYSSLLVAKFTRYSLQKLVVTKSHLLLIAEVARCKKSLVTCCKICLLLVAEVAHCKKSLVTWCKICSLHVAEVACCRKSLVTCCTVCLLLVAEVESLFATLWKSNSSTSIFLWIFAKLKEHLFCRTSANSCFWK